MWKEVEFAFTNYLPKTLEEGMLFVNRISVGVIDPYIELWQLEEPIEDVESFISSNGAPVELFIIDEEENILATINEIGWWDDGDHTDELREVTLDDINMILREYDGYLEIDVDEDDDDETPTIEENRVILRCYTDEEF